MGAAVWAERWRLASQNETPRVVGDANGDGRADVIGFGANVCQVALSTGSAFGAPTQWIAAMVNHQRLEQPGPLSPRRWRR
jgi:hypothetical protein